MADNSRKVLFAQINKLKTYTDLENKQDNILYFVNETNQIYKGEELYADGIIIKQYVSYLEFPNIGDPGRLYIDVSDNTMYRWDATGLRYHKLGESGIVDIENIYGGSANGY